MPIHTIFIHVVRAVTDTVPLKAHAGQAEMRKYLSVTVVLLLFCCWFHSSWLYVLPDVCYSWISTILHPIILQL